MTNKCKTIINEETGETCGKHELEHPIYSEKPCEKFTPEDDEKLISLDQVEKLLDQALESKGSKDLMIEILRKEFKRL